MPQKLDDCVAKVMAEGKTESEAYAICKAALKRDAEATTGGDKGKAKG